MPTLYLDMDGVLADFNTAARQFIQASQQEHEEAAQRGRWSNHHWQQLAEQDHFYRHLPKMPLADELVRVARQFLDFPDWRIRILSAIPSGNDMHEAFHDKIDWINEHYPGFRVHFGPYSHDKKHHCQPGDILVDVRTSNCQEWREAGGTAVQVHKNDYEQAIKELDALFVSTNELYLFD